MKPHAANPFRHSVRVYWEDTDAGGIVYYANYLKFFERARTEWLRSLGVEQHALKARTGAQFIVSQAHLHYRSPARLDDVLEVTVDVRDAARATLRLAQQALRGSELLVDGEIRIACVDTPSLRPRRFPDEIRQHLE